MASRLLVTPTLLGSTPSKGLPLPWVSGGSEVNPLAFQPFGGLMDGADVSRGQVGLPDHPGIGLESKEGLWDLFKRTLS